MELKEYQHRTLEAFDRWRKTLDSARGEAETRVTALEEAGLIGALIAALSALVGDYFRD